MLVQHFNIMGNQYVDENGHITVRVISKDATKNKIYYLKKRPVAGEELIFLLLENVRKLMDGQWYKHIQM